MCRLNRRLKDKDQGSPSTNSCPASEGSSFSWPVIRFCDSFKTDGSCQQQKSYVYENVAQVADHIFPQVWLTYHFKFTSQKQLWEEVVLTGVCGDAGHRCFSHFATSSHFHPCISRWVSQQPPLPLHTSVPSLVTKRGWVIRYRQNALTASIRTAFRRHVYPSAIFIFTPAMDKTIPAEHTPRGMA